MKLYLVQHGKAFMEDVDPRKSITPAGREETEKVFSFLKDKITVEYLWHSTKLRAIQTAEVILRYFPFLHPESKEELSPNSPVEPVAEIINNTGKNIMIVGHLPFLHKLVSFLVMNEDGYDLVSFSNSCVVCMEYVGIWKIEWVVTPYII